MVEAFQPFRGSLGEADPLRVLNRLDNEDKHQQLGLAFIYPTAATGLDLIDLRQPQWVSAARNLWSRGEPLRNGTPLAEYVIIGQLGAWTEIVSVIETQRLGATIGGLQSNGTSFAAMCDRAQEVIEATAGLVESVETSAPDP